MPTEQTRPEATIFLRPLGSALPLGFFAFGIGMFLMGALGVGWIPVKEAHSSYMVLLTFVAPLEFIAAIIAFMARDTLAATLLGLFGGSWITFGVSGLTSAPGATSDGIGSYAIAFSVIALSLGLLSFLGQRLLSIILLFSSARVFLLGLYNLTDAMTLNRVQGALGIGISVLALYGGMAFVLQEALGKAVLPIGRRGRALAALDKEDSSDLHQMHTEPGVRPRL